LSEIDVAKTKIKDLENDLTSTNATLCAINEETASKNQEYSAELNRKTQVIQQLEVSLKDSSVHLSELQSTKEVVETELSELKQRIVDVEENLESECRAHAAVQRAAGEAASVAAAALQANVEEKEKIEQQLIEYREKAIKLSLELDHSTSALEAAKAEVIQLEKTARFERVPREDLDALSSELKEALLRVSQLEKSLEEKTALLNLSYQKFEAAQARIRVLEQNEEVVSKQVQSFECTIQDLSAQNVNLDKMVAQFQSDLQSKEAELINFRSTNEKIALLEFRLQEVNDETAHMSRIIDGKTDEILRLEEELARVTGSQNDHQKQLQHAEQRFHDKQRELDEIRNSLQSMQSVNDDLVAKLSDKENLNVDLRKNLENSSQRFDLLHSKLESVQSEKSSLSERVRLLESQLECQEQEIGDLRRGLSDVHNERDLSTQLKHRLTSLQAQYDDAVSQCQQLRLVRDEILTHQEQSKEDILRLGSQLQVKIEEKTALEQYRIQSESQKEAILRDYQTVKNALTEKENQLHTAQCQRDEFINQVKILNEKIGEVQKKASASESSSKIQVQRNLEETVDKLKKELVAARSKNEILQLNFETEEDQRNKKIERLDKELETVKQQVLIIKFVSQILTHFFFFKQYAKCKEQLRLLRYRPNEEGTVSLPKPRVSIVVESISIQTDPIADKGFGVSLHFPSSCFLVK
jgi:chromosome segregation ATPase